MSFFFVISLKIELFFMASVDKADPGARAFQESKKSIYLEFLFKSIAQLSQHSVSEYKKKSSMVKVSTAQKTVLVLSRNPSDVYFL